MNISLGSGKGITGKLVATGFGLFFAFVGSQFVKQEWQNLQDVKAMQGWTKTPCTIIRSEVEDDGEDFRLDLAYQYEVNGQTFTGGRYSRRQYLTEEKIGEIKQAQARFAEGTRTDCYVDPADPGSAVLKLPTVQGARTSIGFTLIFPAFGLFFASVPWLGRRKKSTSDTTVVKSGKSPKIFFVIFGLVFALFGSLMLKPLLITPFQKTRDAQNWDIVPATVVSSKVKSHSDDDGTTYSVYIAYRYEIDGREYFGDQYTFMGGSSSGYDSKAEIVGQYPAGHAFTIYVNPADPADSVIIRDYSPSLLMGLIPLVFAIIGIAILYIGFRNKQPQLDMAQSREHIVELKSSSPVKKAAGLSIFTLFWLGIVFFVAHSDAPLLFPVAFGFFGLLLILGSTHSILQIFTPKPRAELTPGNMHPGTSAALRWRISGRADRIEVLTVKLRCLKIDTETRRSGGETRTSIVKTPLFEHVLLDTGNQPEIVQGALQFTIPGEQPPSRPGKHDGIQWLLEFHGTIVRWPDMKSELPFTVYPQG